jgi:flagellin-like hook-associated protein FlgL
MSSNEPHTPRLRQFNNRQGIPDMSINAISGAALTQIARYQAENMRVATTSAARLAAGRRFLTAAEDPAAATTEISMRAQRGADAIYLSSAKSANSTASAAADGLQSAGEVLAQLRSAVEGLDEGNAASATSVQVTVAALLGELDRLSKSTTDAAGHKLLDGSITTTGLSFRVARSGSTSDTVTVTAASIASASLGSSSGLALSAIDFTAGTGATTKDGALAAIKAATSTVTESLDDTAATASAMSFHTGALTKQVTSIDAAIENLVGVDVVKETLAMTRAQLLAETAAALQAQTAALQVSVVRQLFRF